MKANVKLRLNKCKKMSGLAAAAALSDAVPRPERAAGLPPDGITMPRDR